MSDHYLVNSINDINAKLIQKKTYDLLIRSSVNFIGHPRSIRFKIFYLNQIITIIIPYQYSISKNLKEKYQIITERDLFDRIIPSIINSHQNSVL